MEILYLVLNDLSFLDKILEKFVDLDVRGATILDSEGMASAILKSEGLSFLLSGPFQQMKDYIPSSSKTIFVVTKKEKVLEIVEEVSKIVENSKSKSIGFMFSVPVSDVYPLRKKE